MAVMAACATQQGWVSNAWSVQWARTVQIVTFLVTRTRRALVMVVVHLTVAACAMRALRDWPVIRARQVDLVTAAILLARTTPATGMAAAVIQECVSVIMAGLDMIVKFVQAHMVPTAPATQNVGPIRLVGGPDAAKMTEHASASLTLIAPVYIQRWR